MTKFWYWFLFCLLAISLSCKQSGEVSIVSRKEVKPNIILIQADDLGFSDLAIHGNPYVSTPNLDKLAREGVQFNQFYVTPVCATTRAALLTGRHHLKTGVSHVHGGKDFLHLSETILAEKLQEAGYKTGIWGKWHSGKTKGYFPWERGFDEAYMAGLYHFINNKGLLNGIPKQHTGWTTEVLTNYALDFINRNKEESFFAYLPYLTCHGPIKAKPELKAKYLAQDLPEGLATLYGMVEFMDEQIGRILKRLEELGLSENTIVIFLSDNGPAVNHRDLTEKDRKIRYINQLRGHKGNIWENGIKSPLFIRWKGKFQANVVNRLADVSDIFPTLLSVANVKIPTNLDGWSLLPYLKGDTVSLSEKQVFLYANKAWQPSDRAWSPEGVYNEYEPVTEQNRDTLLAFDRQVIGIRNERYKLLLNASARESEVTFYDGYALFDMQQDPKESNNLFKERPDIAQKLRLELEKAYQENYYAPHAFNMPVFQIRLDSSENPVLAFAPHEIKGSPINAINYLGNWRFKGDAATYQINVQESGTFALDLKGSIDKGEAIFLLKSQTDEVEIYLSASRVTIPVEIQFEEGIQTIELQFLSKSIGSNIKLHTIDFNSVD